jgi:hypothetical protein
MAPEAITVGVAPVGQSVTGERPSPVPKARGASASRPRAESAPRAGSTEVIETHRSEPTSPAPQPAAPTTTNSVPEPAAASTGKPQAPTVFGRRR